MNQNFCPGDILNELDIVEIPDIEDRDVDTDSDDTDESEA